VTELGVSEIVLVKTQNSNAEYEDADSLSSLARVCVESAEQCERLSVPRLVGTVDFQQISSHWEALLHRIDLDLKQAEGVTANIADSSLEKAMKMRRLLVCRERFAGGNSLLQTLLNANELPFTPTQMQLPGTDSLQQESLRTSKRGTARAPVHMFVGPEGGFTALELQTMSDMSSTFRFVTLGDR
jgi:16S rRNA U1498 N3-methylase RsmE